ncbi:cytidylyltransferase domain-containing protein [Geminocystis sp. CENA526]|uniref:cytidylyltransferase domain-containing protein n=1 Tax=Geminocystis sp. CENA526 TaxID=1355871 RepID=UPI003D6EFA1A
MKTVAIIQARMGSTRLPNKVIKTLCDRTVLSHVIDRVKNCNRLDQIVVATTTLPQDDAIVQEAQLCGVNWFRGNETNVLERYYLTAKEYQADTIMRITSDCPLLDIEIIEQLLSYFQEENNMGLGIDYLSNTLRRSFPIGLDAEVFTSNALERAYDYATKDYEKEHVTPYIYQHPDLFSLHNLSNDDDLSHYRWTLDTPEDYELIKIIYENLYPENSLFGMDEILSFLENKPHLTKINGNVKQKQLGE